MDVSDVLPGLYTNLLSNLIWVVVVAFVSWIFYRSTIIFPLKRLWRIKNPKTLVFCASNSALIYTGMYHRPSTGIGQVRALALIIRSLYKAYGKNVEIKDILLSTDSVQDRWDRDIIILGGPQTNEMAKDFLASPEIREKQPVMVVGNTLLWREKQPDPKAGYSNQNAMPYVGEIENDQCVKDYGFVIRACSPFNPSRTVVLFTGSHTYGTAAIADYFTGDMRKKLRWELIFKRNVVALVSLQVKDGYYYNTKLERKFSW